MSVETTASALRAQAIQTTETQNVPKSSGQPASEVKSDDVQSEAAASGMDKVTLSAQSVKMMQEQQAQKAVEEKTTEQKQLDEQAEKSAAGKGKFNDSTAYTSIVTM